MTGSELKAILDARGWTPTTFALHIGMSRRQVDRWCLSGTVPRFVDVIAQDLPRRVVTVDLVPHTGVLARD
jgi:hypothetical protein